MAAIGKKPNGRGCCYGELREGKGGGKRGLREKKKREEGGVKEREQEGGEGCTLIPPGRKNAP